MSCSVLLESFQWMERMIVAGDVLPDVEKLAGVVALAVLHHAVRPGCADGGLGQQHLHPHPAGVNGRPHLPHGGAGHGKQVQHIQHPNAVAPKAHLTALGGRDGELIPLLPPPQAKMQLPAADASEHQVLYAQVHLHAAGHQDAPPGADHDRQGHLASLPAAGADL